MATGVCRALARERNVLGKVGTNLTIFSRSRGSKVTELFPQRLILPDHGYTPTLSPTQVSALLTVDENTLENQIIGTHVIRGYDSNQLGSNFPCEDRRAQAKLLQTPGTLYGVFDGHGGIACSQAVSERLFDYIATSLLPHDKLEAYNHAMQIDSPMDLLMRHWNTHDYINEDMSSLYRNSLQKHVVETLSLSGWEDEECEDPIAEALINAFQSLDNDMSNEALPTNGNLNEEALEVGLSGSCGCVVHVDHLDVHVANIGDCRAVLGQLTDEGEWVHKTLTTDHNTSNKDEVDRIVQAHPISETSFIMKNNRLLGQLIPTRAFGDFRYKWSLQDLKNVVKIVDTAYSHSIIPMNYYTPPYLSCTPELTRHKLTPHDRFIIIASDGLWDMMENQEAVQLVGEYLEGKETKTNFKLRSDKPVRLGKLNKHLKRRASGLANKTIDTNACTHLIRNALGGEHPKVSEMLTLPPEVVRYYRDDITITVVFFDGAYLKEHATL